MKTQRMIIALIVILSQLLSNVSTVFALPPLPSSFYGTIKIGGANVPDGTTITAWINGVQYASTVTLTYGGNSVYALDVQGDDSTTLTIEGGVQGNTVVFHIGTQTASQTGIWASGTNVGLNLTATPTSTTYALTVSRTGTGTGTVTSNPVGVNCGVTCSANFNENTSVTLTAAPATGSTFTGWSGAGCTGTNTCSVTMDAIKTVTATFSAIPPACYALTLSHTGQGSNPTASPIKSAACVTDGQYVSGANITLSGALPTSGWQIKSWTGTNNNASTESTNTVTMPASSHSASVVYEVDMIAPTVISIMRADPDPTGAASVRFTVTFSESVNGVDTSDFTLATEFIKGASVDKVSGSGSIYTVTVDTGYGKGSIRLDLVDDDTIMDSASNPLGGPGKGNGDFSDGQEYTKLQPFYSVAPNDGWTLESSEFSNTASTKSASGTLRMGDDARNKQYRSLLYFDTASLPNNADIKKVTVQIKKSGLTGVNPFFTHGDLVADIKKGFFGLSPLELIDFKAVAAPISTAGKFNYIGDDWYQLNLSHINFKYINPMGVTQFRLRFTKDDNNDKGADFISFYGGEGTYPPQLIVEYTVH